MASIILQGLFNPDFLALKSSGFSLLHANRKGEAQMPLAERNSDKLVPRPKGELLIISTDPSNAAERQILRAIATYKSMQGQTCLLVQSIGLTRLIVA